eukprot:3430588-Rhodomonas_salina.2
MFCSLKICGFSDPACTMQEQARMCSNASQSNRSHCVSFANRAAHKPLGYSFGSCNEWRASPREPRQGCLDAGNYQGGAAAGLGFNFSRAAQERQKSSEVL